MDTNIILSKSAQCVQDFLQKKGLAFSVMELSSSTRTANDAATTIGCGNVLDNFTLWIEIFFMRVGRIVLRGLWKILNPP